MRILLSNDDGVHAPGLRTLFQEVTKVHAGIIIAPLEERSTTGHSLSLDKPLRLERFEENIYGCSGFPSDCVLMGLGHVMKANRPELVLSGINRGANLGQDLYYSGTIAAAREAAFHDVPAVAVSLVLTDLTDIHRYETAAKFIGMLLDAGIEKYCPNKTLINVNVPNCDFDQLRGVKLTEVGFRNYSEEIHVRKDARGRDYFWIAGFYEGNRVNSLSDCQAVADGFVSITPQELIGGLKHDYTKLEQCIMGLNAKFVA